VSETPLSESLPAAGAFALAGEAAPPRGERVRLLRVLRTVVRSDSDPARQALFANLMQSRLLIRFAFRFHDLLPGSWGSMLVIGCYGLVSFLSIAPPRRRGARVLAVAQHENARRHIDRVCAWVGADECGVARIGGRAVWARSTLVALLLLPWRGGVIKVLRTARAVEKRHGLMVACRAIRAISWYARARTMLRQEGPGVILVSSDSNPEELAFLAAARVLGIPRVFVSHAYPTPLSPPLDFSLSILEGEAAVEARRRKGPITGAVLLAGIEGESVPVDTSRFCAARPAVGIFTPKAVAWPTLAAIIEDCRRHFHARQILIRWHPSMLERPHLTDWVPDRSGIVESAGASPLEEAARQCDWVIADENSNVHLPVLKMGIPTIAVKNLGLYPASRSDLYGFIANRIVFPPVTSVRDVSYEELRAFFGDGWARRFARYDVSYLQPGTTIGEEVRRAILALGPPLERPRSDLRRE
jgi:hypothetical protein